MALPRTLPSHTEVLSLCPYNFYNWLAPRQIKVLDVSIDLMTIYIRERATALKTATHNLQITILRQFYRWCIVKKFAAFDPTIQLVFSRQAPRSISPLSEYEIGRLLESSDIKTRDGIPNRAMLEILYATGIRCSELIGLTLYSILRKERALLIMGKECKERAVIFAESAGQWLDRYLTVARPQYWNARDSHQLFFHDRQAGNDSGDFPQNIQSHYSKLRNHKVRNTAHHQA